MDYKNKILQTRNLPDGKITTIQVSRSDKKQIDVDEVRGLLEAYEKKAKKNKLKMKFKITALNNQRWLTLKGFDQELDILEFEDYYVNKVSVLDKFEKFQQLHFTVMTEN